MSPRVADLRPRHALDVAQCLTLAGVLAGIELGLRFVRVERIASALRVHFLEGGSLVDGDAPAVLTAAERRWMRNTARVLRRWPLDATCLRRSLLTGWVLRRHAPVLILGVRTEDGQVAAHAWLRVGGFDLDPGARSYVTFDRAAASAV
jgi:hypothetical protein